MCVRVCAYVCVYVCVRVGDEKEKQPTDLQFRASRIRKLQYQRERAREEEVRGEGRDERRTERRSSERVKRGQRGDDR